MMKAEDSNAEYLYVIFLFDPAVTATLLHGVSQFQMLQPYQV